MKRLAQTGWILLLGAALLALWGVALRVLPRAQLAETNYQANQLRLEAWLLNPVPTNVLAGTSISGRLLPSYFAGTPLASLASLGLDGASPLTALTLVQERATAPRRVFLELHPVDRLPAANDALLLDAARGFGVRLAESLPVVRANARPSTVLYSWLKERREGGGVSVEPTGGDPVFAPDAPWLPPLVARVNALRARGVEVVLLRLPVGRMNPPTPQTPHLGDALSAHLGLPLLDLNREAARRGIPLTYTDGLHLSPASARRMAALLAELAGP